MRLQENSSAVSFTHLQVSLRNPIVLTNVTLMTRELITLNDSLAVLSLFENLNENQKFCSRYKLPYLSLLSKSIGLL